MRKKYKNQSNKEYTKPNNISNTSTGFVWISFQFLPFWFVCIFSRQGFLHDFRSIWIFYCELMTSLYIYSCVGGVKFVSKVYKLKLQTGSNDDVDELRFYVTITWINTEVMRFLAWFIQSMTVLISVLTWMDCASSSVEFPFLLVDSEYLTSTCHLPTELLLNNINEIRIQASHIAFTFELLRTFVLYSHLSWTKHRLSMQNKPCYFCCFSLASFQLQNSFFMLPHCKMLSLNKLLRNTIPCLFLHSTKSNITSSRWSSS